MTVSVWLDDSSVVDPKQQTEVDVVIIGGGIIGAGCAYMLSQRGNLKVAIVDGDTIASGASGRNGGFVQRGVHSYYNLFVKTHGRQIAKYVYEFAQENLRMVKEFVDKHGNSFHYEPCGSYLLACSIDELEDLSASAALMKEDGFELKLLTEDPLDRDFYGAMENPGDCAINPVKFARALVAASSAQIFENETVCRIDSDGNSVLISTTKRVFRAERALVATNAYTPLLLANFIDKIKPARGQAFVTQPLRKRVLEKLCCANYGWEYFRQLSDNRLILGGSRQLFLNEEFGYADMITKPVQSALEGYLKDRFPDLAGVPIVQRWSGIMAFTVDGLPLVGELEKSGVFFAVGFNGHGFGYGLNMCKLLVDVAMDGVDPGVFKAQRALLTPTAKTPTAKKPVAAAQEKGP